MFDLDNECMPVNPVLLNITQWVLEVFDTLGITITWMC